MGRILKKLATYLGVAALNIGIAVGVALAVVVIVTEIQDTMASDVEVTTEEEGLELEADTPLFDMENIQPGDADEGKVTVENQGERSINYSLSSVLEDGDRIFFQELEIEVIGEDGDRIFEGNLNELESEDIAVLLPGEEEELVLEVKFPEESGNVLQDRTASVDFVFGALRDPAKVEDPPDPPPEEVPPELPEIDIPPPPHEAIIPPEDPAVDPEEEVEVAAALRPAEGGEVHGTGEYEAGEEVTLAAEPYPDYTFAYWMEDDIILSRDPEFALEADQDRQLKARFWQEAEESHLNEVVVGEDGTASVSVPGLNIEIRDAEPGTQGYININILEEAPLEEAPSGTDVTEVYYQLEVSGNLEGSSALLEMCYQGALPPPEEYTPQDLRLLHWNESLERWDESNIAEQTVIEDIPEEVADYQAASRQVAQDRTPLAAPQLEQYVEAEVEELQSGDYGLFYLAEEPALDFITDNILWIGLLAFLLGLAGGVYYIYRGHKGSEENRDLEKEFR